MQLITSTLVVDVYSLLPAPALFLHDCLAMMVMVLAVPPIVVLTRQKLVKLMVPLPEFAAGMDDMCRNQGLAEVAVHVMSGLLSTVPAGLILQFLGASPPPNDTLVSLSCVCVVSTYPAMVEVLQLSVEPRAGKAIAESVEVAIEVEIVLPIGVMNGETALVPLEAVMLGVAKAGEVTTIRAEIDSRATSMVVFHTFMVYARPFWQDDRRSLTGGRLT